ncbi:hypothetical protein ACPUYX_12935 [Desulfosporosinus sp. SYSU MS00001]|uniref:hypothetical protein n=1 Tax=Desulfosporosinus sp. SYSU MS00001 TaxID=3416284 RepID=UPI003CE7E7CF
MAFPFALQSGGTGLWLILTMILIFAGAAWPSIMKVMRKQNPNSQEDIYAETVNRDNRNEQINLNPMNLLDQSTYLKGLKINNNAEPRDDKEPCYNYLGFSESEGSREERSFQQAQKPSEFIAFGSTDSIEISRIELIDVSKEIKSAEEAEVVPDEPIMEAEVPDEPIMEAEVPDEPIMEAEVPDEPIMEAEVPDEPIEEAEVPEEPIEEAEVPEEPIEEAEVPEELIEEAKELDEPIEEAKVPEELIEVAKELDEPIEEAEVPDKPIEEAKEPDEPIEEAKVPEELIEVAKELDEPIEEAKEPDEPIMEDEVADEPIEEDEVSDELIEEAKELDEPIEETKELDEPIEETEVPEESVMIEANLDELLDLGFNEKFAGNFAQAAVYFLQALSLEPKPDLAFYLILDCYWLWKNIGESDYAISRIMGYAQKYRPQFSLDLQFQFEVWLKKEDLEKYL